MTTPQIANPWNARLYDSRHSFVWKYGEALLELLAAQAGEKILDLGCGTGHLTSQLAARGAIVVGVDSSPEMIDQARLAYPGLRFEIGDALQMSFQQEFDAVFSNAVLHWVMPPQEAIARIRAALRPGGRFVAEFGGRGNTREMLAALERQSQKRGIADVTTLWYFPGIAEYTGLLEQQGFEVTEASLFDRPTPLEGETGMRDWFEMFARQIVERIPAADRQAFLADVEAELRPALYRDQTWVADYRRLRIVARL